MAEPRATERNPWKAGVIVGATALAVVGGGALAMQAVREDGGEGAAEAPRPTAAVIEDCNRHAAAAARDGGRILRDGVVGGALGAGVGAAGGAIADGGDGAGKGAGIGALLGATAGGLYGLNEENRRTESAREAYRSCMARRGYAG